MDMDTMSQSIHKQINSNCPMTCEEDKQKCIASLIKPRATNPACSKSKLRCNANDRYRTIDGTCNNLENTKWGSAGSRFRRLLDPTYVDKNGLIPRGGFGNMETRKAGVRLDVNTINTLLLSTVYIIGRQILFLQI